MSFSIPALINNALYAVRIAVTLRSARTCNSSASRFVDITSSDSRQQNHTFLERSGFNA